MDKFIKRYNDYSCIKDDDMNDIKKLSHYTKTTESLIDICNGNFWTTDINDFGDKLEGKLILHRINEILSSLNVLNMLVRLKNGFKIVLIGFRGIQKYQKWLYRPLLVEY